GAAELLSHGRRGIAADDARRADPGATLGLDRRCAAEVATGADEGRHQLLSRLARQRAGPCAPEQALAAEPQAFHADRCGGASGHGAAGILGPALRRGGRLARSRLAVSERAAGHLLGGALAGPARAARRDLAKLLRARAALFAGRDL